uniref:Uncharacterized protein n=1 Tax=Rhizophora mucronata TaxID=61149 RepID=A0A2P2QKV6_RHIMU
MCIIPEDIWGHRHNVIMTGR